MTAMIEQEINTARRSFRVRVVLVALGGFMLLAVALPLAYFGRVIVFQVTPELAAQRVVASLQSDVGAVFGSRAYVLGSRATLRFDASGFIGEAVEVDFAAARVRRVQVELRAAPVKVVITTEPSLADTRWR
ncbi:MAG: hypothetical protein ACR2P7_05545, partial [bacterium]